MGVKDKNILFVVSCAAHLQEMSFIINVNFSIFHPTGPVCYGHLTRAL